MPNGAAALNLPRYAAGQPRLYPNLRAAAYAAPRPGEVFSLHEMQGRYTMRCVGGRGLYVPNARYIFVRMAHGQTLMHPRLRHPALAQGEPVLYAGEAYFMSGVLRWWSNSSGHYRPDVDHAPQAGLPLALFRSWDDVIRRGVLAAPPATSK